MSVVNIKTGAEYDVYIGRPRDPDAPLGWGNPFRIGRDGSRAEVIAKYRAWLWDQCQSEEWFIDELATLHGKTLGCFCAPQPCHGDVLLKAAAWAFNELIAHDKANSPWFQAAE